MTASSATGSSCIQELLSATTKFAGKIKAGFRSDAKAASLRDATKGNGNVEIIVGADAFKPESLKPVFEGSDVAVIVTPMDHSRGFADDAKLSNNMVQAAVNAGVKHIIYLGSWTVHSPDRLPLLASRFAPTEALLRSLSESDSGVNWTNLRCGYFMQNLGMSFKALQTVDTLSSFDGKWAPVDNKDIGRAAAHVAMSEDLSVHAGKSYEMSGPEMLSVEDMAKTIGDVLGRTITFKPVKADELPLPPMLKELVVFMEGEGEKAVPFSKDTATLAGSAKTFREWVAENAALFERKADA